MTTNKVSDESKDKAYFTITPQLVWALSKDPYDFTLWNVIKMIAGDSGECYLSTEDLATLAMMSAGKISQCRKRLMEHGLLEGEIRRDPGYPQPVWHLSIPDLWERNLKWRQEIGDDLRKRIELKGMQKSLHLMKASPGEDGTPPGEDGTPPGEDGTPPNETKEIQKEIQPNNQKGKPQADPLLFEKERATIAARTEAGGNWADADNDSVAEAALVSMYDALDSEPPREGSDDRKQQIEILSQILRDRGVKDTSIAAKAGELMGKANLETPHFANPRLSTFPGSFGLLVGRAKKQTAKPDRYARTVELAAESQAALAERRAAMKKPIKGDPIWKAAKRELQLQMTKATFDTWVRDTYGLPRENGIYTVMVPNALTRDWLDNRLKTTVQRTLVGILGEQVGVQFKVADG